MRRRTFLTALLTPLLPIEKLAPVIVPKTPVIPPLGDFRAFAFPMIRRTFPELSFSDLVGIQPMDGPSGTVFALNIVKPKLTFTQSIRAWIRKQAA